MAPDRGIPPFSDQRAVPGGLGKALCDRPWHCICGRSDERWNLARLPLANPLPWQDVPTELKDRWREKRLVKNKDLMRYLDRPKQEIRWALETDDDD